MSFLLIPQLFVPHFAMSAFMCIYLQHRINKQLNRRSNYPDVVSSISQLCVPHFAMSTFMWIYLQHHMKKMPNVSFEFLILLTFDRLKQ